MISVQNNGKGIPIVMHRDEKMYVPSMIFGHLLTSSNYDDSQRKVTGGRNGYGAKLCNIYSKEFTVETVCDNKHFKQVNVLKSNSSFQCWTLVENMKEGAKKNAAIRNRN